MGLSTEVLAWHGEAVARPRLRCPTQPSWSVARSLSGSRGAGRTCQGRAQRAGSDRAGSRSGLITPSCSRVVCHAAVARATVRIGARPGPRSSSAGRDGTAALRPDRPDGARLHHARECTQAQVAELSWHLLGEHGDRRLVGWIERLERSLCGCLRGALRRRGLRVRAALQEPQRG